jgi:hypothetical protein
MGILDEAIREHLDLKRKHGAREVEVQELEHEAFGPALQTGELPASPQAAQVSELAQESLAQDALEEPPLAQEPAGYDLEAEAPAEFEAPPEPSAEQVAPQPPTQEFVVPEPPAPPPPGTEERVLPFGRPETGEAEAPAIESYEPPTEAPIDKMDESLSVITEGEIPTADFYELDEEEEEPEGEEEAHFAPPEPEAPAAEAFEEELEEEELQEEFEEEPPGAEPEEEDDDGPALFDVESDSDVLEETPDFLRERPDDDELWFEQRPPKDFDL